MKVPVVARAPESNACPVLSGGPGSNPFFLRTFLSTRTAVAEPGIAIRRPLPLLATNVLSETSIPRDPVPSPSSSSPVPAPRKAFRLKVAPKMLSDPWTAVPPPTKVFPLRPRPLRNTLTPVVLSTNLLSETSTPPLPARRATPLRTNTDESALVPPLV